MIDIERMSENNVDRILDLVLQGGRAQIIQRDGKQAAIITVGHYESLKRCAKVVQVMCAHFEKEMES